jgi:cephalosporin hydroxylase
MPEVIEPTNVGEFIAAQRFSFEEKVDHTRIIKEFTNLYYMHKVQTWCNTKWRGVPLCKAPTDLWIYQELIEELRPDLIIETGTLCGGSALFLRDMLKLIFPNGQVFSIDIDHSKVFGKAKVDGITYIKGSSVDPCIVLKIEEYITAAFAQRIMVILDSDHSKEHVLQELALYAPLVTKGSALIIEDTNTAGPKDAVDEWEPLHPEFQMSVMCEKFMLTFNRGGYFERVT